MSTQPTTSEALVNECVETLGVLARVAREKRPAYAYEFLESWLNEHPQHGAVLVLVAASLIDEGLVDVLTLVRRGAITLGA